MEFWTICREWTTFAADICILLITIYTFYLTFISKRIKLISISQSGSHKEGNSIAVVIENKTTSTIAIKEVSLIINNTDKIEIKRFESPITLSAFSVLKIETNKFSYARPEIKVLGQDAVLEIKTTNKILYVRKNRKTPKVINEMKKCPANVNLFANLFNGRIVPEKAKYVLIYKNGERSDSVFIFESGAMTEDILGFNAIPKEAIESKDSLHDFFYKLLSPIGIKFLIEPVNEIVF